MEDSMRSPKFQDCNKNYVQLGDLVVDATTNNIGILVDVTKEGDATIIVNREILKTKTDSLERLSHIFKDTENILSKTKEYSLTDVVLFDRYGTTNPAKCGIRLNTIVGMIQDDSALNRVTVQVFNGEAVFNYYIKAAIEDVVAILDSANSRRD